MVPGNAVIGNEPEPTSQFATLPPMAETTQVQAIPINSGVPVAYVHPSEAQLLPNVVHGPFGQNIPGAAVEAMGPMQIHNLARYEKFEDGIEVQR